MPDSVQFDHLQITDVPGPVPVHLWLDHAITTLYTFLSCFKVVTLEAVSNSHSKVETVKEMHLEMTVEDR